MMAPEGEFVARWLRKESFLEETVELLMMN
jgi:hypothetical protein